VVVMMGVPMLNPRTTLRAGPAWGIMVEALQGAGQVVIKGPLSRSLDKTVYSPDG
jgi:hypothetical protein